MAEIIPAIIPEDFRLMRNEMAQVKDFVDLVQIDVIDGRFAPEPTWPYANGPQTALFEDIVDQERGFPFWKDLQFEVDLMVEKPEEVLDDWISTGASAVIIHADSTKKHKDIFEKLKRAGVAAGLALKPSNSNELVKDLVDEIDFLQIMGNDKIGYHGVELDPLVYDKIADLRDSFPDLPISIDIGVDFDTASQLAEAGATRLVSGSAIFESEDIEQAITDMGSKTDL